MSILHGWIQRLRHVLSRRALERELDEELAFHIEQDRLLQESVGATPAEARRAAHLRFGSTDRFREEVRDTWTGVWLLDAGRDVRHGVRRLLTRPAFSAVALCTLALGIGANTAMFSIVRSVLLDPFPYGEPDELVLIWNASGSQTDETWMSARELVEYRAATRSFASVAAYTRFDANLTGELEPERVRAAAVTGDLFGTLDVPALRGRTFTEVEDVAGADEVVVLGHDLWQRRFGGADIVGTSVEVNGRPRHVLGIMPPDFRLPLDYRDERSTELWIPAAIDAAANLPWGSRSYYLVGRLATGVTPALATADLQRVLRNWEEEGHVTNANGGLDRAAFPLDALLLGGVRPALLLLFGAVGFILLIACANVMHLLLARADTRRREVATQAALGASRGRIARQLIIESGILALAGAAAGLLLAWVAVRAAPSLVPVNIIRARAITLDASVLAFTALLALGTTILAGLAPALQLARVNVAHTMTSSRGDIAPLRRRVRRSLVILETALSLVLVTGAALLARSFLEMRSIDLGFDTARVLTLRVQLPASDYPDDERTTQFYSSLLADVRALPGVESAAAVRVLPLTQTIGDWSITLEGREYAPKENPNGDWQIATASYLETMRIPLLAGRYPTAADRPDTPPVAVINSTMAERYWPGEDALGRRFHLGTLDQPWIEVIGIIPPVRHNAVIEEPREEMVLVHSQFVNATGQRSSPQRGMTLVVRTAGEPLAMLPAVRGVVRRLDPRLPISDVRSLADVAATALAQPRFTALLFATFALLALLLAAIGLYGVISFMAARRTNEMGVRLALGAQPRDVAGLVMREGLALAGAGVLIGSVAAAALSRLVETQLFGVAALDPATFLAVPAVLLAVAALAAYLPARRAAAVSPIDALAAD
jgi:putative ABC transport system permease protein